VSARHQVNGWTEFSTFEGRSGRRNGLSSFGAGRSRSAASPRASRPKGWDLVLTCSPTPSFHPPGIAPAFLLSDIVGAIRFPATGW